MRHHVAVLLCLMLSGMIFGCGKIETPPGLPELVPVTIVVTQDGQPLAEASVALYGVDSKWAVGGSTDRGGRAVIQTLGKYRGAPAGTYKVCFWKELSEGGSVTPDDPSSKSEPSVYYDLIDEMCKLPETTPFDLTISPKKSVVAPFDVGKPIKKRLAAPR